MLCFISSLPELSTEEQGDWCLDLFIDHLTFVPLCTSDLVVP